MAQAVRPGTARWSELVESGIAVTSTRNWVLGDAALEIAPMSTVGVSTGALDNLRRYAEEIGLTFEALRNYRNVSASWSNATRVASTCWKVHQMLASRPELIRSGMTVTQAHAAMGQSTAGRTGPNSSPQARARQTLDNLADPATRDYLRKMAKTPVEDLNLQAVAAGGKVTPRAEPEPDVLDAIRGIADAEELSRRKVDALKRLAVEVADAGPYGADTPIAQELRQIQLIILDAIVDAPDRVER